jgi:hypothetical protein
MLGLVALAAAIVATPAVALAYAEGIVGQSGRNNSICTSCHAGGSVPIVEFEAPQGTEFEPGAVALFRLKITSTSAAQTHAGFDVAPSRGNMGVIDEVGTHQPFRGFPDITHTEPRANDAQGVAIFEFNWLAPATPGAYTLFGAGNSVNLDDESGGDNAAATTLSVRIVGPATPTPTATATAEATATPTTPPSCTGDCDGSGSVTVDEIVRGVNIALGSASVDDCLAFDRDGNRAVTVDEIVEAIDNALVGCG